MSEQGLFVIQLYDPASVAPDEVAGPFDFEEAKRVWRRLTDDGTAHATPHDTEYFKIVPLADRRPVPSETANQSVREPALGSSRREGAIRWARDLMERSDWVILDTETTGLDGGAEVVQISVVDPTGATLFSSLIRPTVRVSEDARAVHGITDAQLAEAPSFAAVFWPELRAIIAGKVIVSYNAAFDRRILMQSALAHGLVHAHHFLYSATWDCAMEAYAVYVGEWQPSRGRYRWQPLPGAREHDATADCLAVLALIRRMAGYPAAVAATDPSAKESDHAAD